jgi:FkbM family methyltransferase
MLAAMSAAQRLKRAGRRALAAAGVRAQLAPRPFASVLAERPGAGLGLRFEYLVSHRRSLSPEFFFVQIGAFDGKAGDPLYGFITAHGWEGILVEPQPGPFAALQETYRDVPGLSFRNVAISETPGTRTLYYVEPSPGVSVYAPQMASFDRSIIAGQDDGGTFDIRQLEVRCVSLDDLLAEAPRHIDLLQIDVEGYDAEIIRMLDLARFAPSIIRFEHKHLEAADWQRAMRKLADRGYQLAVDGDDTVAYLP